MPACCCFTKFKVLTASSTLFCCNCIKLARIPALGDFSCESSNSDNASSSLPVNNRAIPKNNPKSDDPISCSFALVYISAALFKSFFLSEAIPDVKSYETSFNVFTYVSPFIFLANDIGVFLGVV